MEGYDKGPVGQGTTGRGNYVPGILAELVELAASIPSITSVNARRARRARREHSEHCDQGGNPLVYKQRCFFVFGISLLVFNLSKNSLVIGRLSGNV